MKPRRDGRMRRVLTIAILFAVAAGVAVAVGVRRGDFDGSGVVETSDLFDFAQAYREREDPQWASRADLNEDGRADETDIFIFLQQWNEDRDRALEERALAEPTPSPTPGEEPVPQ